jgi:hypothetical protein
MYRPRNRPPAILEVPAKEKGSMPVPAYDIFSGRVDKSAVWIETVEGLGNAYELMTKIAAETPGPYFIFCSRTHTVCGSINTSIREHRHLRISA